MNGRLFKTICCIAALWLALSETAYAAKTSKAAKKEYKYKYTISYLTDEGEAAADDTVAESDDVSVTASLTDVIPEKDGYTFAGWSETGYDNGTCLPPSGKINLKSDTTLYAVFIGNGTHILSYEDNGKNILPAQKAADGHVKVTDMIPEKSGCTFIGWNRLSADADNTGKARDKAEVMPGDIIGISRDTVLEAVWISGDVASDVSADVDGDAAQISLIPHSDALPASYRIWLRNLITGEQSVLTADIDSMTCTFANLAPARYEVWAEAETSGRNVPGTKTRFTVCGSSEDDEIKVYADGKRVMFDAAPVITDGSTMVPMRATLEALGASVSWDENSMCASAVCGEKVTKFTIGSNDFYCNGQLRYMPVAAVIENGRTLIPLRAISESFGLEVEWDGGSKTVYISSEYPDSPQENIYYITNSSGNKYLSCSESGYAAVSDKADDGAVWIVRLTDEKNKIYEIYNFKDLNRPLEITSSEVCAGQGLRLWNKSGYDGYLWKIVSDGGGFVIKPANNTEYSLSLESAKIVSGNAEIRLVPCR